MADPKQADALLSSVKKETESYSPGLEGVVAARSRLCQIDGTAGKLFLLRLSHGELAEGSTYENLLPPVPRPPAPPRGA